MTSIELLAPARNVAIAREAILHGADAVYIGAPRFGARASAGNSLDEIGELVAYAHIYGVKVYVTLNTILLDDELDEARQLAIRCYEMGVDALIVQDVAFLMMDLPPIALHASTQMDNRTADRLQWLHQLGYEQAVLARELTLDEIAQLHHQVPEMKLEAFVHGATCVSYNGQCYASQYLFGRSANRGECAQFCRMPFDVIDGEGRVVVDQHTGQPVRGRHILSLHDMCRADDVEAMLDAGVASLKIEGRLKDETYVKNVVAFYRHVIDGIIRRRPGDYQRSSLGESKVLFAPQLDRTFNRGFQDYFLHGRTNGMVQQCSPKSMGQHVGFVKEIRRHCFTVGGTASFSNGDGLCFVDRDGQLQGFRVNRVEGNCLYPKEMPNGLQQRTLLYRNYDQAFTAELLRPTAQRRIPVNWHLTDSDSGVAITLSSPDGIAVSHTFPIELTEARQPQEVNIIRQLSRVGETPFETTDVVIDFSSEWFLPSSILAQWRRQLTDALCAERQRVHFERLRLSVRSTRGASTLRPYDGAMLDYRANVSNRLARKFYMEQGAKGIAEALEAGGSAATDAPLMTLRYCPRHELGLCPKQHPTNNSQSSHRLSLRSADGRVFSLRFDCRSCMAYVLQSE